LSRGEGAWLFFLYLMGFSAYGQFSGFRGAM
jgi:hypothetical protein